MNEIETLLNEEEKQKLIDDESYLNKSIDSLKLKEIIDINNIISKGFFTLYPLLSLFTTFSFMLVDGIEMCIFGLLIIPIEKYFNTKYIIIQCLSSILFIGVAIGSFLSGYITKIIGRTLCLKSAFIIIGFVHFLTGIFFILPIFFISRLITGICLGIYLPVTMNILTEYLPIKFRGFYLMFIWCIFNLGLIVLICISKKIMPTLEENDVSYVYNKTSIIPIILSCFVLFFLFDSPRNLIIMGENINIDEGIKILENMNKKPLTEIERDSIIKQVTLTKENKYYEKNLKVLFDKTFLKTTVILIILFLVIGFGYYGILVISTKTSKIINKNKIIEEQGKEIYFTQLSFAIVSFICLFINGFIMEIKYFGRKILIIVYLIGSSIVLAPILFYEKMFTSMVSISLAFNFLSCSVGMAYIVEIYPTKIRDLSSGFLFMVYRFSCFLSQFIFLGLFKINYKLPYIFMCLVGISCGLIGFLLPYESQGRSLDAKYIENNEYNIIN